MVQRPVRLFLFARYEIHMFGTATAIAGTLRGMERLMKVADEVDHEE